jgi:hypothetical protein
MFAASVEAARMQAFLCSFTINHAENGTLTLLSLRCKLVPNPNEIPFDVFTLAIAFKHWGTLYFM